MEIASNQFTTMRGHRGGDAVLPFSSIARELERQTGEWVPFISSAHALSSDAGLIEIACSGFLQRTCVGATMLLK